MYRSEESKYVGQASNVITFIRSTTDKQALYSKGQELNRIIQNALAAHISSRDLITIEQLLTQSVALSEMMDQRDGGYDMLLQERKLILQGAYERLDASF